MPKRKHRNPIVLFTEWLDEASEKEPRDPNAMALASTDASGRPSVRMMLLKGADENGFVFYTNLESQKGEELVANPRAALCFYWKSLGRQVRVEGRVEAVADGQADDYFATRPRTTRIGAWASKQSRVLAGRFELERAVARFAVRFGVGAIPRPPHWSGFRVIPERIEFWREGLFRLHERVVYIRDGDGWKTHQLYP